MCRLVLIFAVPIYHINPKYSDIHARGNCVAPDQTDSEHGWETSGLIPISGLRTFILRMKFHFYACSQDHPFVSKIVIWVNICLKYL